MAGENPFQKVSKHKDTYKDADTDADLEIDKNAQSNKGTDIDTETNSLDTTRNVLTTVLGPGSTY